MHVNGFAEGVVEDVRAPSRMVMLAEVEAGGGRLLGRRRRRRRALVAATTAAALTVRALGYGEGDREPVDRRLRRRGLRLRVGCILDNIFF